MTLQEAHERAMRSYVRARVLEGWLPEGAARDAVETWGVPEPARAALIDQLSADVVASMQQQEPPDPADVSLGHALTRLDDSLGRGVPDEVRMMRDLRAMDAFDEHTRLG